MTIMLLNNNFFKKYNQVSLIQVTGSQMLVKMRQVGSFINFSYPFLSVFSFFVVPCETEKKKPVFNLNSCQLNLTFLGICSCSSLIFSSCVSSTSASSISSSILQKYQITQKGFFNLKSLYHSVTIRCFGLYNFKFHTKYSRECTKLC